MTADDSDWMNIEGAAKVLGVSRSKAYNLVRDGVIPSARIGKSVRVNRESLLRWISEQERIPDTPPVWATAAPQQPKPPTPPKPSTYDGLLILAAAVDRLADAIAGRLDNDH